MEVDLKRKLDSSERGWQGREKDLPRELLRRDAAAAFLGKEELYLLGAVRLNVQLVPFIHYLFATACKTWTIMMGRKWPREGSLKVNLGAGGWVTLTELWAELGEVGGAMLPCQIPCSLEGD